MLTVYKKELRSCFHSFFGWLFMAVLLFFLGVFFTYYNMSGGTPYLAYPISSVLFFVLLIIPFLTMRIWSEEKKQKTDQLLFTAPVRTGGILFGKFLALETILLLVVVVFGCYMIVPGAYGTMPYGENILALFAFFLFGSACIAIGGFLSALTESQVIAAVITYAVLLISAFMPSILGIFSKSGNAFTEWMNGVFDVTAHLNSMMNGIVDIKAIGYYLSVIFFLLFLTWGVIQSKRKAVFAGWKRKLFSIGSVLGLFAALLIVNVLLGKLPDNILHVDITAEQMYSLTEDSKKLLTELDEDITIYVLADEATADQAIATLLGRYESESSHISVSYKDPELFPEFAAFYTDVSLEENSLILVGAERTFTIPYSDCYESVYSIDYETYQYYETITGFDGEGQITAGISYLISDDIPVLYVLNGHEEYDLPEELQSQIRKMNLDIQTINLMQYDAVPEDASAILVCGPILDYAREDMAKISDYLKGGGNGLFFIAYSTEEMTQYESLFADYGVGVEQGVVFEGNGYYYYEVPYYLIPNVLNTEITSDLYANNRLLLLAQCRGLYITEDYDMDSISVTPLLETSGEAYSKVNVETMTTMDMEDGDIAGDYYLAMLVEKYNADGSVSKLVITGTEFIVDSEINEYTSGANYAYLTSALSSLIEGGGTVSIPVKEYELSPILISNGVMNIVAFMIIVVIPIALLLCGILIVVVRRRKNPVKWME